MQPWSRSALSGSMTGMGIKRAVPNLACEDLAATKAFYVDVLAFEVVMDLGWVVTLSDPRNRSAQVSLFTHDATAPVTPDVSLEVDDVEAAYLSVQHAGATIVHPLTDEPWGVRRFFVRDPDGKVINVLTHASG